MSLSAGIVGLPNVGKSTLFNTITNSKVEAANYPFATINPNVGIVKVIDQRLLGLASLITPEKIVYATCTFVDIAGLVKGASKGEGLGNQFLANIKEVDAICHVVRCFDDSDITHVYNNVDPIRDVQIIDLELIIADLEVITKKIYSITPKTKAGDQKALAELELCTRIKNVLLQDNPVRTMTFGTEEKKVIFHYNLLTNKPILYVANVATDDINDPESNTHYLNLKKYISSKTQSSIIPLSVSMEYEISVLDEGDKKMFMDDLNIKETGLDKLVSATYSLLDLQTFFTFGKKETRAWTYKRGMSAPECAGVIHSDFEKGFIRCETCTCEDLIELKSEALVKEKGRMRSEGKSYIMNDGDVCHFRFNI